MRHPFAILTLAASLAAGPALAQSTVSPPARDSGLANGLSTSGPGRGSTGSTATGDLPDRTGSTTVVGQTKPPGTTVGDNLGTRPDLEEKSRELGRKIERGICTGCQ